MRLNFHAAKIYDGIAIGAGGQLGSNQVQGLVRVNVYALRWTLSIQLTWPRRGH